MCEHQCWLYLGTYDWSVWMPYVRLETIPEKLRHVVERAGMDNIVRAQAGFDLWRSRDGVSWVPVSRNGFGNPCNFGVRTMASSPYGLFVGVANPFGPTMGVQGLAGWRYEPNEVGGCEVWLGSHDFPGDFQPSPELFPYEVSGTQNRPLSLKEMAKGAIAGFYDGSDFRHCGYWRHPIKTPRQACENLVHELLALLPQETGSLLEVGCGAGATTQAIIKRRSAITVTGTVATRSELAACQRYAPQARFHLVPPTRLKLAGEKFDAAVYLEGPSAAQPASKFFRAVHGALKPGGVVIFADLLVQGASGAPASLAEYEAMLSQNGFGDIQLWDVTATCWKPFQIYTKKVFWTKLLAGEISQELHDEIISRLPGGNQTVNLYVIGRARTIGQPQKLRRWIIR
jgi:SAM-dependent methyltransferase